MMQKRLSYEREIALMEGYLHESEDGYFGARSDAIDTRLNRRLFGHAFARGWIACNDFNQAKVGASLNQEEDKVRLDRPAQDLNDKVELCVIPKGVSLAEAIHLSTTTYRPLTRAHIHEWWATSNSLEDCDLGKFEDFEKVVRAVEEKMRVQS